MLSILNKLDEDPQKYKLFLRTIMIGGSAVPRFLIKSFDERYGIKVLNTWGMTEISPLGMYFSYDQQTGKSSKEEHYDQRNENKACLFLLWRSVAEMSLVSFPGMEHYGRIGSTRSFRCRCIL